MVFFNLGFENKVIKQIPLHKFFYSLLLVALVGLSLAVRH